MLALQELSKHLIGRLGGHTDIVEQSSYFERQEPSGHLNPKGLLHLSNSGERHSLILLTQAPFQHLIWSFPQYTWVGHNSNEVTQVPSKQRYLFSQDGSSFSVHSSEDLTQNPFWHKTGKSFGQVTGVGHSSKDLRHSLF